MKYQKFEVTNLRSNLMYLTEFPHPGFINCNNQGCGLKKITRSPEVPNREIQGAQHLGLCVKSKFLQSPKGKRLSLVAPERLHRTALTTYFSLNSLEFSLLKRKCLLESYIYCYAGFSFLVLLNSLLV